MRIKLFVKHTLGKIYCFFCKIKTPKGGKFILAFTQRLFAERICFFEIKLLLLHIV